MTTVASRATEKRHPEETICLRPSKLSSRRISMGCVGWPLPNGVSRQNLDTPTLLLFLLFSGPFISFPNRRQILSNFLAGATNKLHEIECISFEISSLIGLVKPS
jgi:hypothetical protein